MVKQKQYKYSFQKGKAVQDDPFYATYNNAASSSQARAQTPEDPKCSNRELLVN